MFKGGDINKFRGLIPKNVAEGLETCLAKCKIAKTPATY